MTEVYEKTFWTFDILLRTAVDLYQNPAFREYFQIQSLILFIILNIWKHKLHQNFNFNDGIKIIFNTYVVDFQSAQPPRGWGNLLGSEKGSIVIKNLFEVCIEVDQYFPYQQDFLLRKKPKPLEAKMNENMSDIFHFYQIKTHQNSFFGSFHVVYKMIVITPIWQCSWIEIFWNPVENLEYINL